MTGNCHIRDFVTTDYPVCAAIYKAGIDTGIATFENEVPNWEAWNAKFLSQCRCVAVCDEHIAGWIALSPFSSRKVYAGVAEVTLYIAPQYQGKGIGKSLLEHLITQSTTQGFWTLQAKIFPQNTASLQLFKKCGFRIVGVREKLGMRDGIWHDNVLLERRK